MPCTTTRIVAVLLDVAQDAMVCRFNRCTTTPSRVPSFNPLAVCHCISLTFLTFFLPFPLSLSLHYWPVRTKRSLPTGGSPASLKLKKWDTRSHSFIKDISEAENKFQERYRHQPVDRQIKRPWDPQSARHIRIIPKQRPLRMPHLDSARVTNDDKPNGKRVVKLNPTETQKWRPNGNDCWFAKVGTPAPSVYAASARSSSSTARSGKSQRSARTGRSSARSTSRSRRKGSGRSTTRSNASEPADDVSWEMSASELWDKKIQLERQLEAVREEQDALMCEQLARVNTLGGPRQHK